MLLVMQHACDTRKLNQVESWFTTDTVFITHQKVISKVAHHFLARIATPCLQQGLGFSSSLWNNNNNNNGIKITLTLTLLLLHHHPQIILDIPEDLQSSQQRTSSLTQALTSWSSCTKSWNTTSSNKKKHQNHDDDKKMREQLFGIFRKSNLPDTHYPETSPYSTKRESRKNICNKSAVFVLVHRRAHNSSIDPRHPGKTNPLFVAPFIDVWIFKPWRWNTRNTAKKPEHFLKHNNQSHSSVDYLKS